MKNLIIYRKGALAWPKIILYIIIISAFLPKVLLAEGVSVFLPEFFLFTAAILFGLKQFFYLKEQRYLFALFFLILIFSLLSQLSFVNPGAVLRSIKELLYIPVIYWASVLKDKETFIRRAVWAGLIAYTVNLCYFFTGFSGLDIWADAGSLSSGMSNKAFDVRSFKFVLLPTLAHGIWGGYCVLIFVLSLEAKAKNIISRKLFVCVSALFFVNLVISVSRESAILLLIVIFLYLFVGKKSVKNKLLSVVFVTLSVVLLAIFGSYLPIIQKIIYTVDAVSNTGSESNFQIRVNTWQAYFNFMINNIEYVFIGLGINPDSFYFHLAPYTTKLYVDTPESAFVYAQAFGGAFAFFCLIGLLWTCFIRIKKSHTPYKLITYFFVGIIFTNLISSVSMFSDLLYAHLCLVYGLLILNNQSQPNS